MTPTEMIYTMKSRWKREWRIAFLSTFLLGLLIHLPMMLSDIPNHDGLSSMYFDQNMITSGRWFLTVACGFSTYFTLPWVIGLLGILFLSGTTVVLTELLELKKSWEIIMVGGLLVSFPALCSTFAYVFTLDGYLMALFLATLAVLFTHKYKKGFYLGAVCLAFSMGTYQAYLSFTMLLCIYCVLIKLMESGSIKEKIKYFARFLYMGVGGCGLYLLILQLLLYIQGKELASYQGINSGLGGGGVASQGLLAVIVGMYRDFLSFSLKNPVLHHNIFMNMAWLILLLGCGIALFSLFHGRKWWKNVWFFVIIGMLIAVLPLATNVILFISPSVNYHLLMRYQWVLYPILILAFCGRFTSQQKQLAGEVNRESQNRETQNRETQNRETQNRETLNRETQNKTRIFVEWCMFLASLVLVVTFAMADQIAYSNLQKRYEKTYSYCVRLLDRIEQTEGYYQGIPIAMVGVVGEEQFPLTDITGEVTASMIGMHGDSLLYTAKNYEIFMKHYLGATLQFLSPDEMAPIYYTEEYMEMDSFPGPTSTKVVDGILYVRTENVTRP